MQLVLAIIYIILIAPLQQPAGCVVSSGTNIPADLATAEAGSRCLELPAGTFTVSPASGSYLNATADGLTIRGAGIGRTIIQAQGITLTNHLTLIQLHGARQRVSDLTIQIGVGYSGAFGVVAVNAYTEATAPTIERVEITGGYSGDGGANGGGITTYRVWSTAAGVQSATIRDTWIHDTPSQGMVINSNGNLVQHNRIERVGASLLTHGIYVQGGYNTFDGNTIVQASGYSLHAWQKVQSIDGSGNRYIGNVSIDPGFQHMIVSGLASNGTNAAIPSGKPLTRTVTVQSNTFRNTGSLKRVGMLTDVPALILDNTFEDVVQDGAQVIRVTSLATGSIVRGNAIRAMTPGSSNGGAISIESASICEGNSIDTRGLNYAVAGGSVAGASVGPNLIYKSVP